MILFLIEYLCLIVSFSFFIFCNYKVIKDYSSYFLMLFIILSLKWFIRGFPDSSVGKESICNAGNPGLIPGLGLSPGEGKGYPLQYSGLENSMDCIVYGVTKSWTWLSNFHLRKKNDLSLLSLTSQTFISI